MQCSGNGRKGFLYVFVFGKMLKAAKDAFLAEPCFGMVGVFSQCVGRVV